MASFKDFKNKLKARNPEELANSYSAKSYEDDRYWKLPTPAGSEESVAVIRFLPQKDADKPSFFRYYHFSFKNEQTDQYYIENCLNTFGDNVDDPCAQENRKLWNKVPPAGADQDYYKNICRKRNRKIGYVSNILVVQDKKNPQNNGKVFLFKFGTKILEKINIAAAGNSALGKPSFDPTGFDDGANFALTMHKDPGSGYFQYERSVFGNTSSIGDDAFQELVFNQLYDLDTALDFKTYDELKSRLDVVLGRSESTPVAPDESQFMPDEYIAPTLEFAAPPQPSITKAAAKKVDPVSITPPKSTPVAPAESNGASTSVTDEDMAFFDSIANG